MTTDTRKDDTAEDHEERAILHGTAGDIREALTGSRLRPGHWPTPKPSGIHTLPAFQDGGEYHGEVRMTGAPGMDGPGPLVTAGGTEVKDAKGESKGEADQAKVVSHESSGAVETTHSRAAKAHVKGKSDD